MRVNTFFFFLRYHKVDHQRIDTEMEKMSSVYRTVGNNYWKKRKQSFFKGLQVVLSE